MMASPRVSICVPTYNGEQYLEACFASIVAQTFGDFEVLIVDDCSRDGSMAIARRWEQRDPRFRVHVNDENQGLVGNWNRCIALAKGEWIKFIFQDDLLHPECLDEMLRAGEDSGGFVACSRTFLFEGYWDQSLKDLYLGHQKTIEQLWGSTPHVTPEAYCRAKLDRTDINIVGEPSVVLIRRHLFDDYGLFDPLLIQICDSEMWTRLASNVGMVFVPRTLVTFRVHGSSASETNRNRPFRGMILEGIIESSRFCDSPLFARFREIAERMGRLQALRDQLKTQINIAFYMIRDAERAVPPDYSLRDEMRRVMDVLSGYEPAYRMHRRFRLKRMLGLVKPVP